MKVTESEKRWTRSILLVKASTYHLYSEGFRGAVGYPMSMYSVQPSIMINFQLNNYDFSKFISNLL